MFILKPHTCTMYNESLALGTYYMLHVACANNIVIACLHAFPGYTGVYIVYSTLSFYPLLYDTCNSRLCAVYTVIYTCCTDAHNAQCSCVLHR